MPSSRIVLSSWLHRSCPWLLLVAKYIYIYVCVYMLFMGGGGVKKMSES